LQGISLGQAFGWEAIMTFLLVVTIYSVAVGQPDFGVMGPLAIGLVRDVQLNLKLDLNWYTDTAAGPT
jgi:glycerol uptake facilitator-like aquaporin